MTATLDIDDLVRGVASGNYLHKPGSRFGSTWGTDGLLAVEATPEQYAAFGAQPNVKLCRGVRIDWLARKWTTMLAYRQERLVQVTIQAEPNEEAFLEVCKRINPLLGSGRQVQLPEDTSQRVLRRLKWNGLDGSVTALCTPKYLQVSIGKHNLLRRAVAWLVRQFDYW